MPSGDLHDRRASARGLAALLPILPLLLGLGAGADLPEGRSALPEDSVAGRVVRGVAPPVERVHEALPEAWRARLARVATPSGRRAAAGAAAGAVLLLLMLRLARGRGDLIVAVDYPGDLRGRFRIAVLRKPRRAGGRARPPPEPVREPGRSPPLDHFGVGRETRFQGLRPARYVVAVEGALEDPETRERIARVDEERRVEVARGRTAHVAFDAFPLRAPVDVRVLWDREPAEQASVAARSEPGAVRSTRAGRVRIRLPRGRHVLAVGAGDRVAEVEVEVASHRVVSVEVDLASTDALLFKGCPPAVEPCLRGDLDAAARALERDGSGHAAHLMLARLHRRNGNAAEAARHFEVAERFAEAAELLASLGESARAAELFERAGAPRRAAEAHRAAGDPERAGEAWLRADEAETAAECFREAGAAARAMDALERAGRPLEAAREGLAAGERSRAVRLLQAVPAGAPGRREAALLLADELERDGHLELAAAKLEEVEALPASAVEAGTPEEGAPSGPRPGGAALRLRRAELLERAGELERALELLEALREEDPTLPELATRIEELRKRRSAERPAEEDAPTEAAAPDDSAPLAEPVSRYELLEEIGRGGMGVVYRARDRRLDREIAIKWLPESMRRHPHATRLFRREALAAARLNHPNIVTVFDAGEEEGQLYITMELLRGRPLDALLRERGALAPREAARVGLQVAQGLEYARSEGVVHRDVKTANLFLNGDRTVKIMDFGLAKTMEEVRPRSTIIGGTPSYMSPEQARGEPVDHRTDLYGLGSTLFELATGSVPFTEGEAARRSADDPAPDPRRTSPGLPQALALLVQELLAVDPDERPATAGEVARRLAPLAQGKG